MSYSIDLYLTKSHTRIIWSTTSSQLSTQRRTIHPSHGHLHPSQGYTSFHLKQHTHLMGILTPHRGIHIVSSQTTHPSHGHPHPTQGHTTSHLNLREERHTHLMGTPNSWALSQSDSLSLCPEGCLTKL
jgi:hypothetical protein